MTLAEIVLGIGSSHTPQMSTSAEFWSEHAARDRRNAGLLTADGERRTYDEVLASAPRELELELAPAVWTAKFERAQAAVQTLARRLDGAGTDVVVVIGDDQNELFGASGIPAIGLYLGEELWDLPPDEERLARIPPDIRVASWAAHADAPDAYPVASGLSAHVAAELAARDFDLTVMTEQPAGHGLGHAFTFVRRRLQLATGVPVLPVLLNTYYPPNVPSAGRCYALGEALRDAIGSWPGNERVAVIASGGLSHFVVLEELDRTVLDALRRHDRERLAAIPREVLRSGTSETLNWIAAGGALAHLEMELVDYIPAYRSAAGTGVGMAFAVWDGSDRSAASSRTATFTHA